VDDLIQLIFFLVLVLGAGLWKVLAKLLGSAGPARGATQAGSATRKIFDALAGGDFDKLEKAMRGEKETPDAREEEAPTLEGPVAASVSAPPAREGRPAPRRAAEAAAGQARESYEERIRRQAQERARREAEARERRQAGRERRVGPPVRPTAPPVEGPRRAPRPVTTAPVVPGPPPPIGPAPATVTLERASLEREVSEMRPATVRPEAPVVPKSLAGPPAPPLAAAAGATALARTPRPIAPAFDLLERVRTGSTHSLREAVILAEILGKPRALRRKR